jgi:hypothetical protein
VSDQSRTAERIRTELARVMADRDAALDALRQIAEADAKTPVMTLNRIAERAIAAIRAGGEGRLDEGGL